MDTKNIQKKNVFTSIINTGKDLMALLRDFFLFIIILLLLAFPNKLNELLVNAGFEEGSLVGFKWKSGLAKSDQALKEAKTTIVTLSAQLDSMSQLLAKLDSGVNNIELKRKIENIETKNTQLQIITQEAKNSAEKTISANAGLVVQAQKKINMGGKWGVVYAGDVSLNTAKYEVTRIAKMYNIPNASIFYRQGSYRSVSVVDTREQAEAVLILARKRRADAYIISLSTWCPESEEGDGYKKCAVN